MKTSELRKALAARYCAPEWAFFSELSPETGFANRRMDACALRLWSSGAGFKFFGFELKVSVADFRNDLKEPEKFEQTYSVCDAAFYVTPKNLLDKFAIPSWCCGVLELCPDGSWNDWDRKIYKKPTDIPRATVAALARKCDPSNLDYRLSWAHELHKRKVDEIKRSIENEKWAVVQAHNELLKCQ